jgi:hypothetical protein
MTATSSASIGRGASTPGPREAAGRRIAAARYRLPGNQGQRHLEADRYTRAPGPDTVLCWRRGIAPSREASARTPAGPTALASSCTAAAVPCSYTSVRFTGFAATGEGLVGMSRDRAVHSDGRARTGRCAAKRQLLCGAGPTSTHAARWRQGSGAAGASGGPRRPRARVWLPSGRAAAGLETEPVARRLRARMETFRSRCSALPTKVQLAAFGQLRPRPASRPDSRPRPGSGRPGRPARWRSSPCPHC